jgi:3-oxoacyl-[acyl-carrier protein] reductase
MIENGWGRILLFGGTGTAAIKGYRTTAAYSAAKTALGSLAKSVALEAGSRGVSCNVVCPGFVDTEYCGPADRAYNAAHSPGGKALAPGEVARFALGILEDGRLNGEVLPFERADL